MSSWFLKNLGDPLLADDNLEKIKTLFIATYDAAGSPSEMAVFRRHESQSLHCELVLYFPPLAAALASELNAHPCTKPEAHDLSLWLGNERAWPLLFSEHMN
ncbi:hypothetical protein NO559_00330 [Dasania sp. GY-MA-18]|uniref:Uncharacterized protein n=1 Tax=Dasania phycosphaerae TaxID=2950436 RepID=A0A9J6RH23_9GAMM|nr:MULTISPECIES: hypothetical protein [Dasania]MCR8921197.1 hypothetical protein [Dasania sp. GY-MA-18]MCZ0863625.1 hypothetical protein [Dasania phycosphaerae]MCZ0867353.1 hypothetical protein [Dasania phycosphaerae]